MTIENRTVIMLDDAEVEEMEEALAPGQTLEEAIREALSAFRAKVVNHPQAVAAEAL